MYMSHFIFICYGYVIKVYNFEVRGSRVEVFDIK
jgi:hypothetical protein